MLVAKLMAFVVAVLDLLGSVRSHHVGSGIAALYRPWQRSRTVPYARYAGSPDRPSPRDLVCAHRSLPFGTLLQLTARDGQRAFCVVLDRGPYGYCERDAAVLSDTRCPTGHRYVIARRRPAHGHYRGVIDATPAVHRMLRSGGWIRVRVERLSGTATLLPAWRAMLLNASRLSS